MARQLLFLIVVVAIASRTVLAIDPYIVAQELGNEVSSNVPGQSVWLPSGGPWDQLGFSWYDENLRPAAFGTLAVLDQAYAGEPQLLDANTPGFLARAVPTPNGDKYMIPSGLTLSPSRNYYFYANTQPTVALSRSTANPHAQGVAYEATSPFVELPQTDWAFVLFGQVVPEPTGVMLCLISMILLSVAFHRTR